MMFLSSTIEAYVSPTLMKKAVPTVEAVSGTR
jgi:hypothetical protein